jgi:hypothetical protein
VERPFDSPRGHLPASCVVICDLPRAVVPPGHGVCPHWSCPSGSCPRPCPLRETGSDRCRGPASDLGKRARHLHKVNSHLGNGAREWTNTLVREAKSGSIRGRGLGPSRAPWRKWWFRPIPATGSGGIRPPAGFPRRLSPCGHDEGQYRETGGCQPCYLPSSPPIERSRRLPAENAASSLSPTAK